MQLTPEELAQIPEIEEKDKALIEKTISEYGNTSSRFTPALRGFLASQFQELVPDNYLRQGLGLRAACFADGWTNQQEPSS